jgi:putative endonuclease
LNNNQQLGKTGEKLSVDFLIGKGFKILNRNWRYKKAEIDIIASKKNILIFIEVKD